MAMKPTVTRPTFTPSQPTSRSRSGCDECRRRHWKCNEAKPSCAFCQGTSRICVYSRQLSWGGRPFKKSRFGRCLKSKTSAVTVIASESPAARGDFVYTASISRTASNPAPETRPRKTHDRSHTNIREIESDDDQDVQSHNNAEPINPINSPSSSLDPFASMLTVPKAHRTLLDHFINVTTVSISCHRGVQNGLCSAVLPMAFKVPHVLSAVLALAAAHRQSPIPENEDRQFEFFKGHSLKQLRSALSQFDPKDNDEVLATILLMCMAEVIVPSTADTSVWRSHLHGAAALSAQRWTASGTSRSSTSDLLRRKYQALQAVALACGSKRYDGRVLTTSSHNDRDIDDLAGFSTCLLPVFEEINDLDLAQEIPDTEFICDEEPGPPHFDCTSPLEHRSHLLFDRIIALLAERSISGLHKGGKYPSAVSQDFYHLDEAYHHMAILQVFRRGSLSVPFALIDNSRQTILNCLDAMDYQANPCPGVAALPPLFVAGSLCSDASDRMKVRKLLKTMWMRYGMGNVRQCRIVLEQWWKEHDERRSAVADRFGSDTRNGVKDNLAASLWAMDVLPY